MFSRWRNSLLAAAVATLVGLVLPSTLSAQSLARLRGTVLDEQGGAVPDAQVLVHNQATGEERAAAADKAGEFQVPSLPVGVYTLEVKANGFQTRKLTDIRLGVAQTVVENVRLAVGGVSEEVSVVGETPIIESTTTSVGQVIDQRTVQEIPLNGRHFVDLGLLIPGSVAPQPATGFLTAPLRGQGSFAFNTAGNREDTVNFMINGVNLNDMAQNQITFQPSINTVQEFKVDNQTMSAEYGRNSGAVVNIATRSGSNDVHGELFEFYRNQDVDARNFFNADSQPQSPFKRNQFGANLGGPIVKNKTFFFVSYEGLRQRQALDFNSGVLSDADRALVTDPASAALLSVLPTSNSTGSNGQARFVGTGSADVNIDQWTGDLSHQFSQDDRFHGYYAFQKDQRAEPNLQGNTIPGFGDTRSSHRQILTLNETHIFNPSLVNEARLGFNRINITFAPNAALLPGDFGIENGITTPVLPQITIQSIGLNFGGPSTFPQGRTDTSFVAADTVSYQSGRNSFKFGGEYRRFHNVNFQTSGGTFSFPTVADFEAGRASAFSVTEGDIDSNVLQQAIGVFVQDNLHLRSNLSLELGVRYDRNVAPTEDGDRFVYFDPTTDSLRQLGQAGSRDSIYPSKNNLEPRVGIVWDPKGDGKTAVRAAYALSTDQPVTNVATPTAGNPPLVTPLTFTGPIGFGDALEVAGPSGLAPSSVDAGFENPRIQTWNLNVQRELWSNFSVMLGYFGAKGDDLRVSRNLNQFVNGVRPFPRLAADSPILPGSALGNIAEITSLGRSRYDGLWVTLTKRFSGGLQLNGSYTLSKSKDTNSLSSQGIVVQDSSNIDGDYALSDFDARHRYVLSGLWELPFKGNQLKEGWQLSVITQGQSGNPINVVTNLGFTGVINTVRPDLVGNIGGAGTPSQWFGNTVCDPRIPGSCTSSSVFALPVSPSGVFHNGDLARNSVIGPGFFNTDLSLIKRTKVGGTTLEFRAEGFNIFNHPNLGQPGRVATVGSTSLGVITATRFATGDSGSARQIQFALKLLF